MNIKSCFGQVLGFLVVLSSAAYAQSNVPATSIVVPSANLFPESIALDPATGNIYLSSVGQKKIVVLDTAGTVQDLFAGGAYGFEHGLGVKINRETLWAVSSARKSNKAAVFAFDLKSRALLQKYIFSADYDIFLNDLCFDRRDNLYLTDSRNQHIYRLNITTGERKIFYKDALIRYPNGITYDSTTNCLFIASDSAGLIGLSLAEQKARQLKMPPGQSSTGLDGIYFYRGSVIGVFNGATDRQKHCILRFYLNSHQDSVRYVDTLQTGELNAPTTGFIENDRFYFLAKTYLPDFINKTKIQQMSNEIRMIDLNGKDRIQERLNIINEVTRAFNNADWNKLLSYYSDNAVYLEQMTGKEPVRFTKSQVRKKYQDFRKNFPDLKDQIIHISFQNNEATIEMRITGTHATTGEKLNDPARIVMVFDEQNQIIKEITIF